MRRSRLLRHTVVRVALLGAAAALVLVPANGAQASAGCGAPQARVDAALRSLSFPWRSLGFTYVAEPARSDGTLGMTFTGRRRTELYVRGCAQESQTLLRHVVAHEVGHAVAVSWTSDGQHAAWVRARGLPSSTQWYACNRCPVWDTAEGDFVEVFSFWQTGQFRSTITSAPSPQQLRSLLPLIPRASGSAP